jgi:hypothetical protein
MAKLLHDFEEFLKNSTFFIWDDFDHYVTADTWTTTATNSGTIAVGDTVGGVVKINPSSNETNSQADNDETYMHTTAECFKFATDKPIFAACKLRPYSNTIANLNVSFGFKDAVAADSILDDGAGPAASYSGAIISKLDGGTVWQCESSISTSQTTVNSGHTVGNNSWDVLAISVKPLTSTTSEVHFYSADVGSDGDFELSEIGKTTPTGTEQFVAHTITHTSATEMELFVGVKAGSANNSDYVDVDWIYAAQKR